MSLSFDTRLAEAFPAPPVYRRRRRSGVLIAALAVATLAAAGVAGAVVVSRRTDHPDGWDPRALELVAFVERDRGLTFKHPVRIDFLDDDAFRKEVTETESPDKQEARELTTALAMLRAVGLLSGDVDLMAAGNELAGDGIIGLYDHERERVIVRGTTLDDQRRSTLVHELTHALQDQHFGIGAYIRKDRTSGESAAYRAVVEADATEVEEAWRGTLPAAARESLDAAEKSQETPDFKGVPKVFIELMAFPYVFGPDFVQAVVDRNGATGRNRLFTEPPTTEEHIVLPATYLNGQKAQRLKTPALDDGEEVVEDTEDDFGMLSLLVMLAERIDFGVAWPAVQGWAGDSSVAFERAGVTCVRGEVVFDQAAQAERFAAAFSQWGTGRPAQQKRVDRWVSFESCDPGAAAAGGRAEGHVAAIEGLALRKGIAAALESGGIPATSSLCIVDGLLERLTADRLSTLVEVESDPARREIQQTIAQLLPGCR